LEIGTAVVALLSPFLAQLGGAIAQEAARGITTAVRADVDFVPWIPLGIALGFAGAISYANGIFLIRTNEGRS
jgi:hypothetical protein